jgi:hypothetical protein
MNASQVADAWLRIERWLAAKAPLTHASLQAGAGAPAVADAQRRLGLTFPDDLVASLQRHDGCEWSRGHCGWARILGSGNDKMTVTKPGRSVPTTCRFPGPRRHDDCHGTIGVPSHTRCRISRIIMSEAVSKDGSCDKNLRRPNPGRCMARNVTRSGRTARTGPPDGIQLVYTDDRNRHCAVALKDAALLDATHSAWVASMRACSDRSFIGVLGSGVPRECRHDRFPWSPIRSCCTGRTQSRPRPTDACGRRAHGSGPLSKAAALTS